MKNTTAKASDARACGVVAAAMANSPAAMNHNIDVLRMAES